MNVAVHVAMHAAAARAAAEARIVRQLRDAGAVSPRSAISLDSSVDGRVLEALLKTGVVVQAKAGRFFVDEEMVAFRAAARRRLQTRAMLVVAALVLVVGLLSFLAS